MKRYLEQLLEDVECIQNRALEKLGEWNEQNSAQTINDLIEPTDEGGIALNDLFGLQQMYLPDHSYLDDEEIKVVSMALIQLWRAHNLYPVFSKNLPRRMKYCLLRENWTQIVYPTPYAISDVELYA